MLKKLRFKFILLNMASVVTVLLVLFVTVCVMDYRVSLNEVKDQLAAQAEAGYTSVSVTLQGILGLDDTSKFLDEFLDDTTENGTDKAPQIGGPNNTSPDFPVAVYMLLSDGETASLSLLSSVSNAAVSTDAMAELFDSLTTSEDGFYTYRSQSLYCYQETYNNVTIIALADMSAASGWQSLAKILALVGLGTIAVFFIISLFFSKWALKPVDEAWTKERRFVADVSHDLKTPLTVILANNAILRDNPDASITEMGQWIESTEAEALEMQSLVTDMLEISRLDANEEERQAPLAEDVDFSGIVEAQALMFESVAFEHEVMLDSSVEPGITVHGQTQGLNRLASTLIDNACKYTPAGGTITVTLVRDASAKHAVFTVNNTGSVIAAEDIDHVFDRFYRADTSRTASANGEGSSGHGLGLAIASAIAQAHNGTLTVESDAEHGTTFTATLPVG